MAKTLKWILWTLVALLFAAILAVFLLLRASGHPKVDGELRLAGLSAPVKVLRDELGVPYIFAGNTPCCGPRVLSRLRTG